MSDRPQRLGDVIDDYCPRCRLLMNHDIAKVTCRTCYNTHDYRKGLIPARRKSRNAVDKKSLMDQVLAGMGVAPEASAPPPVVVPTRKRRDLWADVERLKKK